MGRQFSLYENKVGDEGGMALAEAIRKHPSLKELDLRKNRIGDRGAAALAGALENNTTLQKIFLKENDISDAGASVLVKALEMNCAVRHLDLEGNMISKEMADRLQSAAKDLGKNVTLSCQREKELTADEQAKQLIIARARKWFDSGGAWREAAASVASRF